MMFFAMNSNTILYNEWGLDKETCLKDQNTSCLRHQKKDWFLQSYDNEFREIILESVF